MLRSLALAVKTVVVSALAAVALVMVAIVAAIGILLMGLYIALWQPKSGLQTAAKLVLGRAKSRT